MKKETFCPLPWNSINLRNNGDMRICCNTNSYSPQKGIMKTEDGETYNAGKHDFNEARNAPILKEVRASMLKDEWHPECERCRQEEINGILSRREYENIGWDIKKDTAIPITLEDGTIDPNGLTMAFAKGAKNRGSRIVENCSIDNVITKNNNDAVDRCENNICPAQTKGLIKHFVSKNCMNIDGLGEKIVELLLKENLIINVADIFTLKKEDIMCLNRMGEKSADNIIDSIENAKITTFSNFINGLGIRNIGFNASKILEKYFHSNINLLINASKEDLVIIDDIGEIMAESLVEYFSISYNTEVINRCIELGIQFKKTKIHNTAITDKTFVFTGNFNSFNRKEAINLIEKYGAKATSSISQKTNYIVVGDKAGSKLKKAIDLDIDILSENDFNDLIQKIK